MSRVVGAIIEGRFGVEGAEGRHMRVGLRDASLAETIQPRHSVPNHGERLVERFNSAQGVPPSAEEYPYVIGGIGEKNSNGGTQYHEQNRVYDAGRVATALPAEGAFHPYYGGAEGNAEGSRGGRMMRKIGFTVPGECRGKMRPKASCFAGRARVYTPGKQVEYENWARICFREAVGDSFAPFVGAVSCFVSVRVAAPKSASRKRRAEMLAGKVPAIRRPDLDNCAKSILDALNGIAYADDAQVTRLVATRGYAEEAGVDVILVGE